MKLRTALLLVCLWAANCHVHGLAAPRTTVSLQRSTATVSRGTSRSPLGSSHLLHVDAFDQRHTLRLQPAAAPFADTFRLQTTVRDEEGRLIFKDVSFAEDHDVSELYQDPESGGVVQVIGTRVAGIISPTLTLTADADGQHEAVRQVIVPDFNVKDEMVVPPEERRSFQSSATTRAVSSATVEMYVIVDSTLAASIGTDQKVKNYLAVFWNAVNMRYATFSDPKIQLVLAGALIVRNAADEPYVTSNIASDVYVNGYGAIKSLGKWLYQQKTKLPEYDMAYLMTGKNMFSFRRAWASLAGLAYREAACLVGSTIMYKTAMGEDNSYYRGVITAAHEVAHNLGSPHDGSEGSEACSWDLGYIMSYLTVDSKKLFFSSCSKTAMKKYISTSSASCLQSTSIGAKIPLSGKLPGQILNLDKQCQIETNNSDAYASKSVSEDSLCYKLVCEWKEQKGSITWTYTRTTGRPAAEGSPCKSGGACRNGSCQ